MLIAARSFPFFVLAYPFTNRFQAYLENLVTQLVFYFIFLNQNMGKCLQRLKKKCSITERIRKIENVFQICRIFSTATFQIFSFQIYS